jgi:hypothetical protein
MVFWICCHKVWLIGTSIPAETAAPIYREDVFITKAADSTEIEVSIYPVTWHYIKNSIISTLIVRT